MSDKDKQISDSADDLLNSFDSVLIMVTHYDGDGTIIKYATRGNSYAINGAMREMLKYREDAPFEGEMK